jgi:SAM-dependent methyltransferase
MSSEDDHQTRARAKIEQTALDLAEGRIDEQTWHKDISSALAEAYLAEDSPIAQSGHTGTPAEWRKARYLSVHALSGDGTFLDIGCANGLLMESVAAWAAETGLHIEPYGLDISPELAALARQRRPHWAERIFDGNARFWDPPHQFDFVRTGVEYAPPGRQGEMLQRLLDVLVAPGGRLVVGPQRHNERNNIDRILAEAGLGPVGEDGDDMRFVLWIDKV